MYKLLLLVLALCYTTLTSYAQKARDFDQFEAIDLTLAAGQDQAMLYSNLEDTLKKPSSHLARPGSVEIVGQFSPRWAVAKRNGYCYFIRQSELANLAKGHTNP